MQGARTRYDVGEVVEQGTKVSGSTAVQGKRLSGVAAQCRSAL